MAVSADRVLVVSRAGSRRRLSWTPYLYLLPSLVFLAAFTYLPLALAAGLSLTRWNVLTPEPAFVGLENYTTLAADPLFWLVLRNNLLYALGTIPPTMALALAAALLVNQPLGRLRAVYRVGLFYPTMIPMVAAAMLWVWLLNPGIGLVNHYLGALGLPRVEWLYDRHWALPGIIVMSIWKHFGYFMLIFLAGLQSIPGEFTRRPPWRAPRPGGGSATSRCRSSAPPSCS